MELKVKHYVDDESLEIVNVKYFIDGEEVTPEDYTELLIGCIEANENEYEGFEECEECDGECENCEYFEDEDDEEDVDFEDDYDDDVDDPEFEQICDWAETILDGDLCENCVYQLVQDIYYSGKRAGAVDSKLELIEQLSNDIEELDEE
jgi:hypothetical protein